MHLLVMATVRAGSESEAEVLADLEQCFDGMTFARVIDGCFIASSSSHQQMEVVIANLVSVEEAHDPQLDVAIFFRSDGSRWIVTEPVAAAALASQIAGRAPEVV